jgi:hypothetical protein
MVNPVLMAAVVAALAAGHAAVVPLVTSRLRGLAVSFAF